MNIEKHYGKVIVSAILVDEQLELKFEDSSGVKIFDDGQSCCEWRHMSTDDPVDILLGGRLVSVSTKDGLAGEDDDADEYTIHEVCFVEVQTDKGFITLVNHNEHNGYYGGFCISCRDI